MNERACLLALRKLVDDNRSALLSGLAHQGVARRINQITISVAVPPTGYYFILIHTRRAREATSKEAGGVNVRDATSVARYEVSIHISDSAFPQQGEDHVYETMTLDFRTLVDRIAELIRAQGYFSAEAPDDASRFNLPAVDREVIVTNFDANYIESETGMLERILYSTVEFNLEEKCQTT